MSPLDIGLEVSNSLNGWSADQRWDGSSRSTTSVPLWDVSQGSLCVGGIIDGLDEVNLGSARNAARGDGLGHSLEEVAFNQNMGITADIKRMTRDVLEVQRLIRPSEVS